MSITENKARIGSFTSSEIWKLTKSGRGIHGFGAAALTYIEEKQIELRLGRSISIEAHSQAMAWGKFMEMWVFALMGMEYEITSYDTDVHPTIKHWAGSKDLIQRDVKISDIKCYYPKKFVQYTDALLTKDPFVIRQNFESEYWQLVSNAIINQVDHAEAITFMPYEKDLVEIREMASDFQGDDQWKYRFIYENNKSALPYLPNGCKYKDLNKFCFEVPQEDKDFLTERVELAISLLKQPLSVFKK